MKRLLRSVIDFGDKVSQENLLQNFTKLRDSRLDWERPEDDHIFKYVLSYFQQHMEMPAVQTLSDYFNAADDTETIERLKDIAAAESYIRTNFSHLLTSLVERQNQHKAVGLLKESQEIITKGLIVTEGNEKVKKQGVRDGLLHFAIKANDLIIPDYSGRQKGDLRKDGQAVWEEYQTAKLNKDKVWGKFTGLNNIDKICHGLKKGELHLHAGYAGELKCLPGDATVFDHATSKRRSLKELFESGALPEVTALNREGQTFQLKRACSSHLVQNGVREVFDLVLCSGRRVGATHNHRFFTPEGWRELGDLKPGDFVAVPRVIPVRDVTARVTDEEVKVLGYLIGDGSMLEYISFTASNDAIREDFITCLCDMGLREGKADYETPSFLVRFSEDRAPAVRINHSIGEGNSPMISPVRALLDAFGLWGCGAHDKRVPPEFFGLPQAQLSLFLGALWSTDGSCHAKDHARSDRDSFSCRNDITYGSVSEGLCLDIQSLLLHLGIQSSVTQVDTTYKDEPYTFHTLRVTGNESKRKFTEMIRVVGKEESFARLAERLPLTTSRKIPSSFLPKDRKVRVLGGYMRHSNAVKLRRTITEGEARRFVTVEDTQLREAIAGDLDWEKVRSVTLRGEEMTYDLSVPEHHSFVVNDIVSHNTTFATNWCYNLVTRFRTNVFYASFEMKYEHIRRLIYVIHSSNLRWALLGHPIPLDYRKVRDGELSDAEEAFYQKVIDDFCNNPEYCEFHVWSPDRDVNIDDVTLEVELLHKQLEIGFTVLDHGGLMEPRKKKRNKDYVIELNSVIRDSKKFALHFNHGEGMPTLILFQINRTGKSEADKSDGIYKMNALSYANEAEKSADVVTTSYLNDSLRHECQTKMCNLKNRDNPLFEPFLARVNFGTRRIKNLDMDSSPGMGVDNHGDSTSVMLDNV